MIWEETVAERREYARRMALVSWLRERFRTLFDIPAFASRAEDIDRPNRYDHLAFEIARYRKRLALPTIHSIRRSSSTEQTLLEHDISLTHLCLSELPNAIASFDPRSPEENGTTLEQHIEYHLCAHIDQVLRQLHTSNDE
jgi:hypothetical protein